MIVGFWASYCILSGRKGKDPLKCANTEVVDPIAKPLTTFEEVLAWHDFVAPSKTASLQPRTQYTVKGSSFPCHYNELSTWQHPKLETDPVPKTLLCHDYRGGYLEDKYINGSTKHEEYRFFHWAGIDTFVYFSHKLVTIPPPCWITAGHIHGVKVLGTLITEWSEGEAIWDKILASATTRILFMESLVDICDRFGFDGYLLNVENKLEQKQLGGLICFVQELHTALKEKFPHSELIWYDSVTTAGELKWQNELNDLNRLFFDHCDGIFLNYTWTEQNLAQSVVNAGTRQFDVYVGVDVFGRNCFGGGGFNTDKALEVIRRHGLSVAVFAPGWVLEVHGPTHFACLEYAFWQLLWPHLHLHGPAGHLPFRTSFCQGCGQQRWAGGRVDEGGGPWLHLSCQQHQPSVASCLSPAPPPGLCMASAPSGGSASAAPTGCVQHYAGDAFEGGGCLRIDSRSSTGASNHRILLCDFPCSGQLCVQFAAKIFPPDTQLDLLLVILPPSGSQSTVSVCSAPGKEVFCCPSETANSAEQLASQGGWHLWQHHLPVRGRILEVQVSLPEGCTAALLGWLQLEPLEPLEPPDTLEGAEGEDND